ncbi:unnamed protein product [Paramecium octaurelia]|uniref:Uncharacterized protein n=1 Tax=Paramecium octaurelia TaxID=43137 RepID=A0A8S1Y534_PAROT|nr:unnamed protein product [Paramecium octaurelia]
MLDIYIYSTSICQGLYIGVQQRKFEYKITQSGASQTEIQQCVYQDGMISQHLNMIALFPIQLIFIFRHIQLNFQEHEQKRCLTLFSDLELIAEVISLHSTQLIDRVQQSLYFLQETKEIRQFRDPINQDNTL